MENTLIQHIEISPGIRGGKPRLAGTRITVADIAIMHLKLGQSVDEIATEYDLPLSEGRVLVTHDADFLRYHAEGVEHAGIAYCKKGSRTVG